MRHAKPLAAFGLALTLGACAALAAAPHGHGAHGAAPTPAAAPVAPPVASAKARFIAGDRRALGEAQIFEGPAGLVIRITLAPGSLTPGWHALHVHQTADCSAADFTSSGPHAGHGAGKAHGLLHPDGPEIGDLTNIWAQADGAANGEFLLPFMSVAGAGGRPAMLDADGSAFVIHANPDDHVTQPIGGAGPRVACAVIEPAG